LAVLPFGLSVGSKSGDGGDIFSGCAVSRFGFGLQSTMNNGESSAFAFGTHILGGKEHIITG
jgi:hypothetical protein